jgi:hypothetical protein
MAIGNHGNRPSLHRAPDSGITRAFGSNDIEASWRHSVYSDETKSANNHGTKQPSSPNDNSLFPCDVSRSPDMLALVGLNMEMEKLWEHRVARFLCWPEEAHTDSSSHERFLPLTKEQCISEGQFSHYEGAGRPFFSFVRTAEGSSLLTTIRALKGLFPTEDERTALLYSEGELEIEEGDPGPESIFRTAGNSATSTMRSPNLFDLEAMSNKIDDICYIAPAGRTGGRENDHGQLPAGEPNHSALSMAAREGKQCSVLKPLPWYMNDSHVRVALMSDNMDVFRRGSRDICGIIKREEMHRA